MYQPPLEPIKRGRMPSRNMLNELVERSDQSSQMFIGNAGFSNETGQMQVDVPLPLRCKAWIISGHQPYGWRSVVAVEANGTSIGGKGDQWIETDEVGAIEDDSFAAWERNGNTKVPYHQVVDMEKDPATGFWYFDFNPLKDQKRKAFWAILETYIVSTGGGDTRLPNVPLGWLAYRWRLYSTGFSSIPSLPGPGGFIGELADPTSAPPYDAHQLHNFPTLPNFDPDEYVYHPAFEVVNRTVPAISGSSIGDTPPFWNGIRLVWMTRSYFISDTSDAIDPEPHTTIKILQTGDATAINEQWLLTIENKASPPSAAQTRYGLGSLKLRIDTDQDWDTVSVSSTKLTGVVQIYSIWTAAAFQTQLNAPWTTPANPFTVTGSDGGPFTITCMSDFKIHSLESEDSLLDDGGWYVFCDDGFPIYQPHTTITGGPAGSPIDERVAITNADAPTSGTQTPTIKDCFHPVLLSAAGNEGGWKTVKVDDTPVRPGGTIAAACYALVLGNASNPDVVGNGLYTWLLLHAGTLPYKATTSGDWNGASPTTVQDAIDRIAAQNKTQFGTGP